MALKTFTWDEKKSSDYGLYVLNSNSYDAPERALTVIELPGVNGALVEDEGYFKDQVISYDVLITPSSKVIIARSVRYTQFVDVIGSIRSFLFGRKTYTSATYSVLNLTRRKLIDDYDPRYYRLAYFAGPVDWETMINRYGKCTLNFVCDPRRYFNIAPETFTVAAGETVRKTRPTISSSNYAEPIWERSDNRTYPLITYTGATFSTTDNELIIGNSSKVKIKRTSSGSPGGSAILDTEKQTLRNTTGTMLLNNYMTLTTSTFPYCSTTNNYIEITNNTNSQITVTIDWRLYTI